MATRESRSKRKFLHWFLKEHSCIWIGTGSDRSHVFLIGNRHCRFWVESAIIKCDVFIITGTPVFVICQFHCEVFWNRRITKTEVPVSILTIEIWTGPLYSILFFLKVNSKKMLIKIFWNKNGFLWSLTDMSEIQKKTYFLEVLNSS